MRLKYIIVVLIATVAILFGTYSWVNYFKKQAGLPRQEIKALRPPPEPEKSREAQDSTAGLQETEPAPPTEPDTSYQASTQFPDSVERNPFLTLEEIEMISLGEDLVPAAPPQSAPTVDIELPELRLTGFVKDVVSGNYRAMIDGRAYARGEIVGIEEIVEIDSNSVILEYGGRRRTLTLGSGKEERTGTATIKMKKIP